MNTEEIKLLKKSGEISFKAHKFAQKLFKPGEDVCKLGKKIDDFIIEQGAFPAWPVNLSLNNEAAHNSYDLEKEIILKEDDVLKVDLGVSLDGYITDSSQTIIFNKKHEKLKESAVKALANSKKFLEENYKTAEIKDIGEIVENTIKEYGFKPINNLTGHFLARNVVHATPSIPNTKNNIPYKFSDFKENFAIEPFATTGSGFVNEGSQILIFEHIEDKPVRNKDAKKLLEEIKSFDGRPFSEYWVGKDMSSFSRKFALRELIKSEIISAYPVLVDVKDSYVSQAETTFIITKDGLLDLVGVDRLE